MIQGDIYTDERRAKGDIVMLGEERGGLKGFYARSHLDILEESEIITVNQYYCGQSYWRLKTASFRNLGYGENPIYGDTPEAGFLPDHPLAGHASDLLSIINKMLLPRYREAIAACCAPVCSEMPFIAVRAIGEGTIRQAFEKLEEIFPDAREELKEKLERENTCV